VISINKQLYQRSFQISDISREIKTIDSYYLKKSYNDSLKQISLLLYIQLKRNKLAIKKK
jgi:hypothetical protein